MKKLPATARLYIAAMTLAGAYVLGSSIGQWRCDDPIKFGFYMVLAALGGGLKVSLPGITGTMSVNYVFILLGLMELSLAETLVIATQATLIQSYWHSRQRPSHVQVLFNVSSIALSAAGAAAVFAAWNPVGPFLNSALRLASTACIYFLLNTATISVVIALTERKSVVRLWRECYFWSFPYYLLGASIAGAMNYLSGVWSWEISILILPVVYLVFRSYRVYLGKLESEKAHAEEMASLHLRTIEALALAIEAKDNTTAEHLSRVQVYATEVGRELKLEERELKALQAAAILHDIGKLAVPDYIISKPGKLTVEEYEKMKIHPVVGAEILERVQFPYPVVPIVRSHHEKWDGSGYPDGLRGEAIPIGARILSAVDCLDALASDRQYRRAIPLDEAMKVVASESGKAFDPRVVEVLGERFHDLEKLARARAGEVAKLSLDVKVPRGEAPAAGFEKAAPAASAKGSDRLAFLNRIASARQEVLMLYELTHDLGSSLSLNETLSVLALRLKKLIPHDCIAIYVRRENTLIPEFVQGENHRLFSSLEIPVGQGLSGWVAENGKPIVNGNPSVEPGYLDDASKFSTLRSALAIRLNGQGREGAGAMSGVLALYHSEKDAFSTDHLRLLMAIHSKLSLAIENALRFQQAERNAVTDALTGLPNARSLFLHLDGELARARRNSGRLAVLVCDLDGFKQVNDLLGHLTGNRVLARAARALKDSCREYDYVARMGGDEFILVLPDFSPDSIAERIGRLSMDVAATGAELGREGMLSLSVGHALFPDDGEDAEQLLAEADRRMYAVKQSRRRAPASDLSALHRGLESADGDPAPPRDSPRGLTLPE